MRRIGNAVGLSLLVGLLVSCGGLLGQIIGAQPAENALGLDDTTVTAQKETSEPDFTTTGYSRQAIEYFAGSLSGEFKDVDWEAIKAEAPVAPPPPKSYSEDVGIGASLTLTAVGQASALPDSVRMLAFVVNVGVTDSDGDPTVESTFGESGNVSVTFTKSDTCTADSCTYTTDTAAGEMSELLGVSISGAQFSKLWTDVLTNEDPASQTASNTLSGTAVLFLDSTGTPADTSVTFTLQSANGTINFAN